MGVRNLLDLGGKAAIVTGGSRGIGLQMAEALGEMGAKVAITARKQGELDEARVHLAAMGIECMTFAGDLADAAVIPRLVDAVLAKWGTIDILVNNAGCNWAAPAEDYPDEGWRKVMNLNVDAAFFLSRDVARKSMIPRRTGKIVNIASIAGLYGNPPEWGMNTVAYNTSKGALVDADANARGRMGQVQHQCERHLPGLLPLEDDRGHPRPDRDRGSSR